MKTVNITEICKNFKGKHPYHFYDNADFASRVDITHGRGAKTEIKDDPELVYEFLLWLSPETRIMLRTHRVEEVLAYAKTYKKSP
jgi:hypothetical protein